MGFKDMRLKFALEIAHICPPKIITFEDQDHADFFLSQCVASHEFVPEWWT